MGPFVRAVRGGWREEGRRMEKAAWEYGGWEWDLRREGRGGKGDAVQGAAWIAGAFPLVSLTVVARAGVEALIGDA